MVINADENTVQGKFTKDDLISMVKMKNIHESMLKEGY
jgi:hypothetical protein